MCGDYEYNRSAFAPPKNPLVIRRTSARSQQFSLSALCTLLIQDDRQFELLRSPQRSVSFCLTRNRLESLFFCGMLDNIAQAHRSSIFISWLSSAIIRAWQSYYGSCDFKDRSHILPVRPQSLTTCCASDTSIEATAFNENTDTAEQKSPSNLVKNSTNSSIQSRYECPYFATRLVPDTRPQYGQRHPYGPRLHGKSHDI